MGNDKSMFHRTGEYYNIPSLVHQCMTRDTIAVADIVYFQETVSKLPIMSRIEFKMLKANSKNTPPSWHFEKGAVAVYTESGDFIGTIPASKFAKAGLKTGKVYGFVEPPSYDFDSGSCITPYYRAFVYCDYNAIYRDAHGVIFFKK